MKKLVLLPLLTLTALLGACAPTQSRSSALTPEVLPTMLSPVTFRPGETRYVQVSYPRSLIKVNDKYFSDLRIDFDNLNGQNVNSVEAYAGWLSLKSAETPRGVGISLDRAAVVKDITRTTSAQTEVRYFERVRVNLKVTASADAKPGDDDLVTLTFSDGTTDSKVLLVLDIQQ
ncbi:hypothetical protein [Deinococcus hohokamensis]|uniref:Uncharacterized protein n=1 Tax=Deinococcus hohokamensis TaxID=309883 RepID=A0ABV9IET6_9DEIO